jgi:hypothetical protein
MALAMRGGAVRDRGAGNAGELQAGEKAAGCLAMPELGSEEADDGCAWDAFHND